MSTNDDGRDDKAEPNKPEHSTVPIAKVSSNEERRQAAKAKLEQRLETEHQQARRRKILIASVSTAVVLAVVATATTLITKKILDDREAARWTSCTYADSPSKFGELPKEVPASVPADQRAEAQKYLDTMLAGAPKERVAPKPDERQLKSGTADWTLNTSQGAVHITLNRDGAPCNTAALISLTENKAHLLSDKKVTFDSYFDDTTCPRMTTNKNLQILQCGDPTGTTGGSPGWSSPDEFPTDLKTVGSPNPMTGSQPAVYPRGTVAIANSNNPQAGTSNTGAAQFFLVINDSQLAPNYSVVGKVDEASMPVLDKILKAGVVPGPNGAEDGTPKDGVTIKTATIG